MLFLFIALGAIQIDAQQRNPFLPDEQQGFPEEEGQMDQDTIPELTGRPVFEEQDTQFVNFYLFDQPFRQYNQLESGFKDQELHFDPMRMGPWEYARTGHLGGPARPMILKMANNIGFRSGIDDYRPYFKTIENQRLLYQHRPYSMLVYTQGNDQDKNRSWAEFSNSFDDGFDFGIEYHRINHLGEYNRQRNFQTFISTTFAHHSEDGNWHNFFSFISNAILANENGGLAGDTLPTGEFFDQDRSLAEVVLNNAESRQRSRTAYFSNFRKIGEAGIFGLRLPFYANHYMSFGNSFYKYSDRTPPVDYYGSFQETDRGFRRFVEVGTIEQRFGITIGSLFDRDRVQVNNYLTINLLWQRHRVRFDPEEFTVRQLFLQAEMGISPGDFLTIRADGQLGLGDDGGDAIVNAELSLEFGDGMRLTGEAGFLRREASLMESRYPITEGFVYQNSFPKFTHSYLGGEFHWERFGLVAGFRQHLLFNLPFFNEQSLPEIRDNTLAVPQLLVEFNPLRSGPIILNTALAWQQQNSKELALPDFYLKQRVAVTAAIFDEALDFQVGVDALFISGYEAMTYRPWLGGFAVSGNSIEGHFRADPYLAIQIQSFQAILRFENIGFNFTDRVDYHFFRYPLADFQGRFTIRWQFND
ncbi:MAG: hypothetical protein EA362_02615 [Saprospirales bacterium]|nr:MAG: hypothetical protein EA362_02615 [Saprospirales bacterium]